MKHYLGVSALLICLLFLLPLFTKISPIETPSGEAEPEPTKIEVLPPGKIDSQTKLKVKDGDTVTEMTMSNYLAGVVRAEMPASFEQEALCAQAVAARTYTLYKMTTGGNHGDEADVCTDPTCCQAYLDEESARKNWGDKADTYEAKIENAVAETDGQAILFNGAPILAAFHSSSAGMTKSSGEGWTQDLPYLQSVTSPEQGDEIPNYYSRVELTAAKFRTLFQKAHPEADLSGSMSGWIKNPVIGDGDNVDTVTVGGVTVRGTEMRTIFSLRSASFETEVQGDKIVFFVTGFGHGVGMSQYGANEMAKEGNTWKDIITHYYTGVTVAAYMPDEEA